MKCYREATPNIRIKTYLSYLHSGFVSLTEAMQFGRKDDLRYPYIVRICTYMYVYVRILPVYCAYMYV